MVPEDVGVQKGGLIGLTTVPHQRQATPLGTCSNYNRRGIIQHTRVALHSLNASFPPYRLLIDPTGSTRVTMGRVGLCRIPGCAATHAEIHGRRIS